MSKKANQHPFIRRLGYPYILALFLEDYGLSAEEVAEAWFGNLQIFLDQDDKPRIRFSGRGKQFSGEQILHKDISGTLIFKSEVDFVRKRRYLKSWYIENPFASVPIDPQIFPVESRFVHDEQNMTVSMRWVKGERWD